ELKRGLKKIRPSCSKGYAPSKRAAPGYIHSAKRSRRRSRPRAPATLPPTKKSKPSGSASASHESAIPGASSRRSQGDIPLSRRAQPGGARKVVDALNAAIANVADNPLSARRTSDPTVSVKIVGRYQHKIFYSVEADEIEILHVRHGARRPWTVEG